MRKTAFLAAAATAVLGTSAFAADLPAVSTVTSPLASPSAFYSYYVRLGPTVLLIDGGAKIFTPAGRFPGGTIRIPPQVTGTLEVGYRLTPNWAVSVTAGVPPNAEIDGAGTVTALGKLGSTIFGPLAVTGHYHFTQFGAFQPYIGGGATYLIAFNSKDGSVSNLGIRSALGAIGQLGVDYKVTDRIGVYFDVKKAYLRTTARGFLGAAPIKADVKLGPLVLSAGLTYGF